jgi:diketogulonate reductase-like aldo/keto reductase
MRLLNRREFNGLCVALSPFITLSSASALDAAPGATSSGAARTVRFRDGTVVPALGQGSAGLVQGRHPAAVEEEALRTGLSLGMTLIDTSDDYSGGRSEELISHVIAGQRDGVFLVSKLSSNDVTGNRMAHADHLDLYLLHWPGPNTDVTKMVVGFENLRAAGKIRAWGVSNFTVRQMEDPAHPPPRR